MLISAVQVDDKCKNTFIMTGMKTNVCQKNTYGVRVEIMKRSQCDPINPVSDSRSKQEPAVASG